MTLAEIVKRLEAIDAMPSHEAGDDGRAMPNYEIQRAVFLLRIDIERVLLLRGEPL